jgi:hypothetical protein
VERHHKFIHYFNNVDEDATRREMASPLRMPYDSASDTSVSDGDLPVSKAVSIFPFEGRDE